MGNSQEKQSHKQFRQQDAPTLKGIVGILFNDCIEFSEMVKNITHDKEVTRAHGIYLFDQLQQAKGRLNGYMSNLQHLEQQYGSPSQQQQHISSDDKGMHPEPVQQQSAADQRYLEAQMESLKDEIQRLQRVNGEIKDEKDQLLVRFSKLAGEKLTRDNPAIADLSDKNRPTKLAEIYGELYDNEWTDAFEGLTGVGYTDVEAITTLRMTLINTFEFCKKKSDLLVEKAADAVNVFFEEYKERRSSKKVARHLSMRLSQSSAALFKLVQDKQLDDIKDDIMLQRKWQPKDKSKATETNDDEGMAQTVMTTTVPLDEKLKKLRKEVAQSMVPVVQKAYLRASWNSMCLQTMKPFIKQCLFVGWMMTVQSPPLCFQDDPAAGNRMDANKYRGYTNTGVIVEYIVWPALLLHEHGPLLAKGVAETRKGN